MCDCDVCDTYTYVYICRRIRHYIMHETRKLTEPLRLNTMWSCHVICAYLYVLFVYILFIVYPKQNSLTIIKSARPIRVESGSDDLGNVGHLMGQVGLIHKLNNDGCSF